MLTKTCRRCAETKTLDAFTSRPKCSLGRAGTCIACHNLQAAIRRRAEPELFSARERARYTGARKARLLAHAREREGTPEAKARRRLRHAVKDGKVVRPTTCSKCKRDGPVEAHHHDYGKPLEVTWMCARCHRHKHHPLPPIPLGWLRQQEMFS